MTAILHRVYSSSSILPLTFYRTPNRITIPTKRLSNWINKTSQTQFILVQRSGQTTTGQVCNAFFQWISSSRSNIFSIQKYQTNICHTTPTTLPSPDRYYPHNIQDGTRLDRSVTRSQGFIMVLTFYHTDNHGRIPTKHLSYNINSTAIPRLPVQRLWQAKAGTVRTIPPPPPQGYIVLNFHYRDDHIRIPNKHLLYNINNTSLPTQTLPVQRSAQAKAGHVCNTSPRGHRPLS